MQNRIFLSPPWVGEPERAAVAAAFDSGYVAPCGPMVDQFDRRLGALADQSAAAVSSGFAESSTETRRFCSVMAQLQR